MWIESAAASTLTDTFSTPTSAGHLLGLSASIYAGTTNKITSVIDSGGNTWTQIGAFGVPGHNSDGEMWYAANAKPATTVTVQRPAHPAALPGGRVRSKATARGEKHTIAYRLKDLESRLDPARFIRLGRGTLANIDLITKVSVMPGGTHVAILSNGQKLQVSRLQSRILRERFLKL